MVSVYLSGGDLTPASMPIIPPAPGLFSTMTCCPSVVASRCATKRPITSVGPPGENGTTIFTGLLGYCWAETGGDTVTAAMAASVAHDPVTRILLTRVLPWS